MEVQTESKRKLPSWLVVFGVILVFICGAAFDRYLVPVFEANLQPTATSAPTATAEPTVTPSPTTIPQLDPSTLPAPIQGVTYEDIARYPDKYDGSCCSCLRVGAVWSQVA